VFALWRALWEGEGNGGSRRFVESSAIYRKKKDGYKISIVTNESGLEALTDRSRDPWRYWHQLPQQGGGATPSASNGRRRRYWGRTHKIPAEVAYVAFLSS